MRRPGRTRWRSRPGYAANIEVASAQAQPVALPAPLAAPEVVDAPGAATIAEVGGLLGCRPARC